MQGEQRKAGSPDASQATWNSLLSLAKTSYSLPERKQLRKSHPLTVTSKQIRKSGEERKTPWTFGQLLPGIPRKEEFQATHTAGDWRPRHWLVLTHRGDTYFPLLIGIAGSSFATLCNQNKTKQKKNQDTNQACSVCLAKLTDQIKGKHLSKQEVPQTPNLHQWAASGSSLFLH